MDAALRHAAGGIFGLCDFLDKEGVESALTFDLMMIGRSIHDAGSPRLSWKELKAFITHAPQTSAIRYLADKMAPFRATEIQLLAVIGDTLAGANWQRGGGKGPRPRPLLETVEKQIRAAEQERNAPQSVREITSIRESLRKRRAQIRAA